MYLASIFVFDIQSSATLLGIPFHLLVNITFYVNKKSHGTDSVL